MNLISNIFEIFKELLPDKRDPILVWATKVIIGIMFIVISFTAIRDSPIGVSWGINSPPKVPALTNKEYRDINAVLYTFLIRVREENPDTRGVYFVVAFYKNGNINFADENFDRIGVFTWYSQNSTYISFQTFVRGFCKRD
jgi:hypothetical protein